MSGLHKNGIDAVGANKTVLDCVIEDCFIRLNGVKFIFACQPLARKLPLNAAHMHSKNSASYTVRDRCGLEWFQITIVVPPLRKWEPLGGLSRATTGM